MIVQLWRFALTAGFLLAVASLGSPRAAPDAGICTRMTQYAVGDGKKAVAGTTLTYCANERDCRRKSDQVCCNGWRRDPDSKRLRCIKIAPDDSASIGAVDIAANMGNYEDSTGVHRDWKPLKREAGVEDSVSRPRGSRSAPESNPATKTDQSEVNAPDGQSVQTPDQASHNMATDPTAGSGADRGNRADPPVVAGPAGINASHSLTNGSQPVSSDTSEPHPETNTTSVAPLPAANSGDAPHTSAGKQPTISSTATSREASEGGSEPANGTYSQPEGPPHVVIQHESENSAISHSAVNQSEVESQTHGKKNHNVEHGDSNLTTVAVAPVGSSVSNPNKSEALASLSGQSSDNHASVNKSEAPANLSRQSGNKSGDNLASVNKSLASATPLRQSSDNQASVQNSQALATSPGQSNDNHASVNNSQAPVTPLGQSSDNLANANKSQTPATPLGQNNHNQTGVNNSQAAVTPLGQSNDNHASVNNSQAPVTPLGQSSDNRGSVNVSQAPATPPGQSNDNQASVNKGQAPATSPGQSGDNLTSVNKSQAAVTPPGQSSDNPAKVNRSEALVSPKGQSSDNHTRVNNTGDGAPVQSDQNISSTVQNKQDASTLTLNSKDLAHGRHEEIVPSTESFRSTSMPPDPTTPASVPLSEATTANMTGAAATQAAQNDTSHNSVHTVPSATAATHFVPQSSTTAASVDKPIAVPAPQHPNAQAGNTTIEYNVTVGTNHSSGTSARNNNSSVRTGRQGGASAASPTEKNVNSNSTANCTVAGNKKDCTGPNCLLTGHQKVCNSTAPIDGLQTPPVVKPQPRGGSPPPSASSATKTASELTISLLLVAAVTFVAALLYWRTRRHLRQYINCGTREPNLHFSNPVYDLEAMMEQTSLVKLQNAADVEDGDGDDSEHEATSQRK